MKTKENEAEQTVPSECSGSAEIKCRACGWLGKCDDVLTGDHPFQKGCQIYGCPKCGEIEEFEQFPPNDTDHPERACER